jgi:hypothetical protein
MFTNTKIHGIKVLNVLNDLIWIRILLFRLFRIQTYTYLNKADYNCKFDLCIMGLLQDYEDHFEEKIAQVIQIFFQKRSDPVQLIRIRTHTTAEKGLFKHGQYFYSQWQIFRLTWHKRI